MRTSTESPKGSGETSDIEADHAALKAAGVDVDPGIARWGLPVPGTPQRATDGGNGMAKVIAGITMSLDGCASPRPLRSQACAPTAGSRDLVRPAEEGDPPPAGWEPQLVLLDGGPAPFLGGDIGERL